MSYILDIRLTWKPDLKIIVLEEQKAHHTGDHWNLFSANSIYSKRMPGKEKCTLKQAWAKKR